MKSKAKSNIYGCFHHCATNAVILHHGQGLGKGKGSSFSSQRQIIILVPQHCIFSFNQLDFMQDKTVHVHIMSKLLCVIFLIINFLSRAKLLQMKVGLNFTWIQEASIQIDPLMHPPHPFQQLVSLNQLFLPCPLKPSLFKTNNIIIFIITFVWKYLG